MIIPRVITIIGVVTIVRLTVVIIIIIIRSGHWIVVVVNDRVRVVMMSRLSNGRSRNHRADYQ